MLEAANKIGYRYMKGECLNSGKKAEESQLLVFLLNLLYSKTIASLDAKKQEESVYEVAIQRFFYCEGAQIIYAELELLSGDLSL